MSTEPRSSARDDFLGAFDVALQPRILDFAAHLADLDVDVLMFTARKAACLFDAMREVGLVRTRGAISSDRVLDMDLRWLAGKRVALVDDVVITGSTLFRTQQRLERAGASVTTHVLAVDQDNRQEALVRPANSPIHLEARDALNLCTQIVNALSIVPRPYNLDWPLLQDIVIPIQAGTGLGGMPGWRTTDVTSSLQGRKGVFSLTFDADGVTRRRLSNEVGPGTDAVSLAKVRLYGRSARHSNRHVELRALPIVAYDSVNELSIRSLFADVIESADLERVADEFTTLTSQARLVQFALSRALGAIWLDDLAASTGSRRLGRLEKEQLSFAFPPSAVEALSAAPSSIWVSAVPVGRTLPPPSGTTRKLGSMEEVQDALTAPFADLYLSKEIRARQILKEQGLSAFSDAEHLDLIDRLSSGYSPQELAVIARGYTDAEGVPEEIVSAFLDIAIDHGVIVPIAEEREGAVRRAYRHGEDVLFAEVDYALFSIMLKSASTPMAEGALDRITVEKLCVIFLRIALQRGQLNRWWGRLGAPGTIGVRWYLHGARVQADTETIYGAANGAGLVEGLLARGALEKKQRSGRLLVGNSVSDSVPVSEAASTLAREVGYVFGELLSGARGTTLSGSDLILLASCPNQASTAGALAAEVFLVNQAWPGFKARRRQALGGDEDIVAWAQSQTLFKALQSGTWKYLNVKAKAVDAIIKRVSDEISHPVTKTVWEGYWLDDPGRRPGEFPDTDALVDEAGRWLLASHCYFTILCAADAHSRGAPYRRVMNLIQEARGLASRHHDTRPVNASNAPIQLVEAAVAAVNEGREMAGVAGQAADLLDRVMARSGSILDRTRAVSRRLGEPRILTTYTAAAYIVYRRDQESTGQFERTCRERGGERRRATLGRPGTSFDYASMAGLEDGMLFLAKGRRAAESMTEFSRDLIEKAPIEVQAKVYLFPALEEELRIHSGGVDGASYGDAFVERVVGLQGMDSSMWTVPGPGVMLIAAPTSLAALRLSREKLLQTLIGEARYPAIQIDLGNSLIGTIVTKTGQIEAVRPVVDCVLLTVIPEEYNALRAWLGGGNDFIERVVGGRYVSSATIEVSGRECTYWCAQAQGQGDSSIVNLIAFFARTVTARMIVLVGIGGALSQKLTLGDVVIASSIVDYGPQAVTGEGVAHRGEAVPVHASTLRAAQHLLADQGDPARMDSSREARELGPGSFDVHLAPIGTGYAVIKHRDAEVRQWLLNVNEKVMLLETEAAGIATVFYEQIANEQFESFAVVRAVSDHADIDKDDSWKLAAAANAARVVGALVPKVLALVDGR